VFDVTLTANFQLRVSFPLILTILGESKEKKTRPNYRLYTIHVHFCIRD